MLGAIWHNICQTLFGSPIALDLNGDGIQTTANGATRGTFDLQGNGSQVQSGWLSPGDAFLAMDVNGNGKIDGVNELFGGKYGDGYAKLANLDSNKDGVIDARDPAFAKLQVWQDADSNHQTDSGELRPLASTGIASLNVGHTDRWDEQSGNRLGETGQATRSDGSPVSMVDAYFAYSPATGAATSAKP